MCCFSYLDNEICLKKVILSYCSLVHMFYQNLCTYTSNSEDELWHWHTEKGEAPKPQSCHNGQFCINRHKKQAISSERTIEGRRDTRLRVCIL